MGIKEEAFLAKEIENWRKIHFGRNKEWFSLAAEINRLCQSLWGHLPDSGEEDRWIFTARLLFLRGTMSFQSAVILLSHGLTVDAGTLTRSVFEDVFCLSASRNDETLVTKLIGAHKVNRRKIARAVAQLPPDLGFTAEQSAALRKVADELGDEGQQLNFAEIAEAAGLRPIYDVYYRSLSNEAAHPTLDSLERLLNTNPAGEIESFANGPDATGIAEGLATLFVAGYYLLVTASELFKNETIHQQTTASYDTYKRLVSTTYKMA